MKKPKPKTNKKAGLPAKRPIRGVITARKCAACGHHEMGIMTKDGDYLPLRPGMRAEIKQA